MNSLKIIILIIAFYNVHASDVFVLTPYEIENGTFMLFEQYDHEVILNTYPSFYSQQDLPLRKKTLFLTI